jgi:acylphosphatase
MIELKAVVTGKVQGVRFRDYAQGAAVELGLVGYVKNLPDGSVEVVAQGWPDNLKAFIEYLYEGSVLSQVKDVIVEWRTSRVTYHDFSVL